MKGFQMTSARSLLSWLALITITVFALVSGVCIGTTRIAVGHVFAALVGADQATEWERIVVFSLRLPRVLVAWLVGGALSVSGCVLQGIFLNPLADPGVLGVSSAAALGAVLAMFLGLAARAPLALPACACIGAAVATLAISLLAGRRARLELASVLLAGVAIGNLSVAASSLVISLALANYEVSRQLLTWLLGGLEGRTWTHVAWGISPLLFGTAVVLAEARSLDALLLDEVGASAVGVNVGRVRRRLILAVSVLTGVTVAIGGAIGFVGLVVPHIVRRLVGPLHRRLLPAALLGGGAFLVLADVAARRLIAPEELRLGIVTAAVGAPLFLYLLIRQRAERLV